MGDNTGKTVLITIAVLFILFLIFGFTVPVKDVSYDVQVQYNDTETYQVQEPYSDTEQYTVQEPYTDIEYYTDYITVNVPYLVNVPCPRPPMPGPGLVPPGPRPPIPPGGVRPPLPPPPGPQMCTITRYHNETQAVSKSREVTKYRDVTKTRSVTKYRTVDKTRTVIKVRTETRWKKVPLFNFE